MKKHTKMLIIRISIAVLIVAVIVGLVVFIVKHNRQDKHEDKYTITRGTLYNTVSSSGMIQRQKFTAKIPLVVYDKWLEDPTLDIEDMADFEGYVFETNWADILLSEEASPISYRVKTIHPTLKEKPLSFREDGNEIDEPVVLLELVPVYFNVEQIEEIYEKASASGDADTMLAMLLYLMFEAPAGSVDPDLVSQILIEKEEETKVITTAFTSTLMKNASTTGEDLDYQISQVPYEVGDMVNIASTLFSLSYDQTMVYYTVSEKDYAKIDERLRAGEHVYAALSIEALGGKVGLADVIRDEDTPPSYSQVAGVTYYKVWAKLVYAEEKLQQVPKTEDGEDGKEVEVETVLVGDYTYYDPILTPEYLEGLGVPVDRILYEYEVVAGYSVTVTSQKEAMQNVLIVNTKCIQYDSANHPFVWLQSEDGKSEVRAEIKVIMSNGKETAIAPAENASVKIKEGDIVKYNDDSSLLGIF